LAFFTCEPIAITSAALNDMVDICFMRSRRDPRSPPPLLLVSSVSDAVSEFVSEPYDDNDCSDAGGYWYCSPPDCDATDVS
jgi:hypothetical protein